MLLDVPGENVFDLAMPRDGLLFPVNRIHIDIVAGAVSIKDAAGFRKLPDELFPPHTLISRVR